MIRRIEGRQKRPRDCLVLSLLHLAQGRAVAFLVIVEGDRYFPPDLEPVEHLDPRIEGAVPCQEPALSIDFDLVDEPVAKVFRRISYFVTVPTAVVVVTVVAAMANAVVFIAQPQAVVVALSQPIVGVDVRCFVRRRRSIAIGIANVIAIGIAIGIIGIVFRRGGRHHFSIEFFENRIPQDIVSGIGLVGFPLPEDDIVEQRTFDHHHGLVFLFGAAIFF